DGGWRMRSLPAARLMAGYTAFVAVATVVYLMVPAACAPLWAVIGLSGVAPVVTGIRLHRPPRTWPWSVLAGGLLAFAAGVTYCNVMEEYFGAANPFPSPADALYLAPCPLPAVGLSGLIRCRSPRRDLPSLLDAMIVTGGLALP